GVWVKTGVNLLIVVVYAPYDLRDKRILWDYLAHVEEVPLGGSAFTWCHKSASKMSKLDRFLISKNLMNTYPNISDVTLDRYLLDHRLILLRESMFDYGPTPFRFYHYWLEDWYSRSKNNTKGDMARLTGELQVLDADIDNGNGSVEVSNKRMDVINSMLRINKIQAAEVAQKAKIKWSVEEDENSRFFHGMLNKKRSQLSIRGVMVHGVWIEKTDQVKREFVHHFSSRFDKPSVKRTCIDMCYPNVLTIEQQEDLERYVSKEELKRAVWDCGTDKSPGLDGFTFGFFRHFWSTIEAGVFEAVKYFFTNGDIPKGCNSSFIALILKILDANMVKDFRPISLIGSVYKIIAKILSNRLVGVLGDIVNEVQSAFIAEKKILDGQWNDGNIDTLVLVLECFYQASGLRINMSKSKIMDVHVEGEKVKQAASKLGCHKMKSRLSKWKMKTLSIGGRLTLLKSVLGSIPIFHMSVFRVSLSVLNSLESIRNKNFNGNGLKSKKVTWIKWSSVLAAQAKGGLGVSSLYALNRGLMLKLVWRFYSYKTALWVRVVKAIHGEDGKVGNTIKSGNRSCWLNIVKEMCALKDQGVNVSDYM
nr:RNA-directed DNA polymerase, eukaryota, reverse transcriptase zinc-binding domain protein [Tanacetum cinerariifolium]